MKAEFLDLLKLAQQCLASGALDQAASRCEQAISLEPANAEARNLRGLIAVRQGDHQQAVSQFETAIEFESRSPVVHNNLGACYLETGQLDKAMACFKTAIDCHSDYAVAYKNLGQVNHERGDMEAAIVNFQEALSRNPQYAPAHFAWANLLYSRGDLPAAATHFQQALAMQDDPETRLRLADTLDGMGHHQKAVDLYLAVAAVKPDDVGVLNNLGLALFKLERADEAIACFQKAIALDPNNPVPHNSLGNAFTKLGLPGEAIRCFREALAVQPDYANAHSNLLLNMNYVEGKQEEIYAESLRFDALQTKSLTGAPPSFANIRTTTRKLRIGYVSGDFRSHSVAYFALPLLEAHNRDQFDIHCYSNNLQQDDVTERFQSLADRWVAIRGMSDDAVAEQIRRDEVDILVDLSGHTGDNRLMVFARKPAPVLVSWLGYPNTSGLRAMDYRITDAVADPADGKANGLYTEQLIRLPSGFLCYRSDVRSSPVSAPPEERQGYVTFGSFNMLGKVTTTVVDTWSEILKASPDSHLLLKGESLENEKTKAFFLELFGEREIAPERLDLVGLLPKTEHFQLYSQVDIALDTFPYNGTTTTCEALWMGVPVITLSGSCHAGRVGASILHRVGLTEFVAHDRASYLSLAQSLAGDVHRRSTLRASLRERLQGSALMNQSAFAKEMEDAYRSMWAAWCDDHH